ncbi:MAG: hypothetical protein EOO41_03470, partial [Methanobacteriota archaeon]
MSASVPISRTGPGSALPAQALSYADTAQKLTYISTACSAILHMSSVLEASCGAHDIKLQHLEHLSLQLLLCLRAEQTMRVASASKVAWSRACATVSPTAHAVLPISTDLEVVVELPVVRVLLRTVLSLAATECVRFANCWEGEELPDANHATYHLTLMIVDALRTPNDAHTRAVLSALVPLVADARAHAHLLGGARAGGPPAPQLRPTDVITPGTALHCYTELLYYAALIDSGSAVHSLTDVVLALHGLPLVLHAHYDGDLLHATSVGRAPAVDASSTRMLDTAVTRSLLSMGGAVVEPACLSPQLIDWQSVARIAGSKAHSIMAAWRAFTVPSLHAALSAAIEQQQAAAAEPLSALHVVEASLADVLGAACFAGDWAAAAAALTTLHDCYELTVRCLEPDAESLPPVAEWCAAPAALGGASHPLPTRSSTDDEASSSARGGTPAPGRANSGALSWAGTVTAAHQQAQRAAAAKAAGLRDGESAWKFALAAHIRRRAALARVLFAAVTSL